jgi:5-methylcytosine-specific restriction endonuclease McrA
MISEVWIQNNPETYFFLSMILETNRQIKEREQVRKYYLKNKEKKKAQVKKWTLSNPQNIRDASKRYAAKTGKLYWRASVKLHNWRVSIYKSCNSKCLVCGSDNDLQAHHIYNFKEYTDLRYSAANGVLLCKACHILTGGFHSSYRNINNHPLQFEEFRVNRAWELACA